MIEVNSIEIRNSGHPKFLTFDYEDWFHLLYADENSNFCKWTDLKSRLDYGADLMLEISELLNIKFTIFTLGWIAKERPDLILKLAKNGMEIASHSMTHQTFKNQDGAFLTREIRDSKKLLEDISSQQVYGFRAPAFTISLENEAAINEIIDAGYIYDASISEVRRMNKVQRTQVKFGGPFEIKTEKGCLIEFPIVNDNIYTKTHLTGGGYFRLLPKTISDRIIMSNKSEYYMTYFHPRDFDQLQPRLSKLPFYNRFRAYYGIKDSMQKINTYKHMKLNGKIIDWTLDHEN